MKFPFPLPSRYEEPRHRMSGGQGYIYICKDKFLDRDVAIKVMKAKADSLALRKELEALSAVQSRHVAEVYDLISSHGGTLGLIQEFVPGENLDDYAESHQLSCDQFLRILYQVACGVRDIHSHNRVHRDIKPQNLKFDAEGVLKILDFGLSANLVISDITTGAAGTEAFLGPEFYSTPPIRFSAASDTYAFGVTVWSIGTNNNLPAALLEVPPQSSSRRPSLATLPIGLPPELVVILDETLSRNPKKRPTMESVVQSVERRLLFGRHRAVISTGLKPLELSKPNTVAQVTTGPDSVSIKYDGLRFTVDATTGDAYINNKRASQGHEIPNSCVITLGHPMLGAARTFIPVNTSHPGVVL